MKQKKKSFFNNPKQKLYYLDGRTLRTITEAHCNNLFLYLWDNWSGIVRKHNRVNKDLPKGEKKLVVLNFEHDHYRKITEGLPIQQSTDIALDSSNVILRISNKDAIIGKYDKPQN